MIEVDDLDNMSRRDLVNLVESYNKLTDIAEKRLEFIQRLLAEPKVTIDEWDELGPCVTVHYDGKEYVGMLEEWESKEYLIHHLKSGETDGPFSYREAERHYEELITLVDPDSSEQYFIAEVTE